MSSSSFIIETLDAIIADESLSVSEREAARRAKASAMKKVFSHAYVSDVEADKLAVVSESLSCKAFMTKEESRNVFVVYGTRAKVKALEKIVYIQPSYCLKDLAVIAKKCNSFIDSESKIVANTKYDYKKLPSRTVRIKLKESKSSVSESILDEVAKKITRSCL